jgi:hypothetical protein
MRPVLTVHAVYRLGIWLPLLVPAAVALLVHGLDLAVPRGFLQKLVQVLLVSLVYGGVPYAALALWATWWIGDRPEPEIRRLMLRAPLLMVAVFVPTILLAGLAAGAPAAPFLAVAVLGAIVIIPVGYAYVGVVMLLRKAWGPSVPVQDTGLT